MRALLFLVLSLSLALLSHCSPTAQGTEDCADPLACYLSSLTLAYPETISFDVSGVAVELSQLTIHGLGVGGLPSTFVPDVTLNLSALDLGTSLSFHYKAVVPKKPRPVTGDISVSLAHTNLSLSLYVPKTDAFSPATATVLPHETHRTHNVHSSQNSHTTQTEGESSSSSLPLLLPLSVSFSACAVSPVSITVAPVTPHNVHTQDTQDTRTAEGTHASRSLQELPFSLEELVQTLLYDVVCVRLNATLAHNVTAWLQESVDPSLAEIASHTAAPLPLSPQKHTLAWNESALQRIHTLVDRVSGRANLPEFVRCLGETTESEFLSISEEDNVVTRTVKQILSLPWMLNNEMEIDLSAHALAFSLDELLSLLSLSHRSLRAHSSPLVGNVTVRSVRVRGLDSLSELSLLEPVSDSPAALNSSIAFAALSVDVTIAVSVRDTLTNASYTQESTLSLSLQNVAFYALAIVDIDAHFLDHLSVDQMHLLGCWLAVVREVSLSSLSLTYSELSLTLTQHTGEGNDAGQLEREIAGILDDFSLLLLSPAGYGEAVLAVVQGALQGPVRTKINAFFLDALTKAKVDLPCLTHYPYDDDSALTVWADNAIVHTLNELSVRLLGEDGSGLNKLLFCATNRTGTLVYHGERTTLSLSGLDTFSQLALFSTQPDRPYDLQFKAAIDWFSLSVRGAERTRSVEASTDDVVAHLLALLYVEETLSRTTSQSLLALEDALLQSLSHTFTQKHSRMAAPPSHTPHNALTNSYISGPAPSLTLSLAHTTLSLDVHAEMSASAVSDLTFSQTHTHGCVASTLNTLSLTTLSLNASQVNVSRTATEEFPRDITALINRVLARLGSDDRLQRKNEEYAIKLENAPSVCAAGGVQPDNNDDIAAAVSRTHAWE